MKEKKNKWPLLVVALIAIVGTAVYSGSVLLQYNQGIPEEEPEFGRGGPGDRGPGGGDSRGGPPTEEERQQRLQEMAKEMNLTPDQQAKIQEIMSQPRGEGGREGGRERFGQIREILTPEQQAQMSNRFQSRMEDRMQRRLNEARKSLPEKEVRVLEEQMQERRKQMEQRRREGRGGPPGRGEGRGGNRGGGNRS